MTTWKDTVRVATTENLDDYATTPDRFDPGPAEIDGVTLAIGDRVLVKNQVEAEENGLYEVVSTGPVVMERTDTLEAEAAVCVSEGDVNAHSQWSLITQGTIVAGTTELTFVKRYSPLNMLLKEMGDAAVTLTIAEASRDTLELTGALTNHRELWFPPADAGRSTVYSIRNATSGGFDVVVGWSSAEPPAAEGATVRVAPGTTSIVRIDESGVHEITGGTYDPRDFGAKFDGLTDDLPALDGMIAAMPASSNPKPTILWPRGTCWISDRWVINRAVQLVFNNGNALESTLEVAHGKMGIVLDGSAEPFATAGALFRPNLRGYHLVHPSATGNASGNALLYGCKVYNELAPDALVRKGECWVMAGEANPDICFRAIAMVAGEGRGPAPIGGDPEWSTVVGAQTEAFGITWRTEKLIKERQSEEYQVGDRVLAPKSNVYYFECVEAGTSAAGTELEPVPVEIAGWRQQGWNELSTYASRRSVENTKDGPYDLNGLTLVVRVDAGADQTVTFGAETSALDVAGVINGALTGATATVTAEGRIRITSDIDCIDIVGGTALEELGFELPNTFLDGGVRWAVRCAAGIYLHCVYTYVDRATITGFMGPAIYAVGGAHSDRLLGEGFVDGFAMRGPLEFVYCGMGLFTGGRDCNGWWVDGGMWGTNLGALLPTPADGWDAITKENPGDFGGGHLLHDNSLAAGYMGGLYAQTNTGYPVLKNSTGILTCVSCYSENGHSYSTNGETTVIGGTLYFNEASDNVISPNIGRGRGISQLQRSSAEADEPYVSREVELMLRGPVYHPNEELPYVDIPDASGAKLYAFWAQRDKFGASSDRSKWGWIFNKEAVTPPHWWALNHGGGDFVSRNAFDLSSAGVGLDPGAGWLCFEKGYLKGDPADVQTVLFTGHIGAIDLSPLRGGKREKGDSFRDGDEDVVVLESQTDSTAPVQADSYHGMVTWTDVDVRYAFDYPDQGSAGTRMEPSETFGETNNKVFRLKGGGTKAELESPTAGPYTFGEDATLEVRIDFGKVCTISFAEGTLSAIDTAFVMNAALLPFGATAEASGGRVKIISNTSLHVHIVGGTTLNRPATPGPFGWERDKLAAGVEPVKGKFEPDWSAAVNPGDTVEEDVLENGAVWELVGYRPPLSRQKWQTKTDAAGQKIAEIPIEPNGTSLVTCIVTATCDGTTEGFTAKLSGSFKRNGAGNIDPIGTEDCLLKKTAGLAIVDTATTPGSEGVYFNINDLTKRVEVFVDPDENVTLDYTTRIEVMRGFAVKRFTNGQG